ncbi:cytochrome P450 4C1-like [Periplaneta americana]|uniref:cytochrome P450 4C1-like n=1 Tax=Periplaneta americana TaxID=6978 RepID=UPI0037E767DE
MPTGFTKIVVNLYKQDVPLVRIWVTVIPVVVLFSADHVQAVLSSKNHIDKSSMYNVLKQFLGNALITGSGQYWQRHRKMISPTFHMSVLENFIPTFVQNSKQMVANMKNYAESGTPFDIAQFSFSCTLDIICETAMGTSVKAQETNLFRDFSAAITALLFSLLLPGRVCSGGFVPHFTSDNEAASFCLGPQYTSPCVCPLQTRAAAALFTASLVFSCAPDLCGKRSTPDCHRLKKRSVFLDFMLELQEQGCGLSDAELMHEVNTFIVAGHETSSQTASFCLFFLGLHLDIQDHAVKELDEIFEGSDRDATMEDLRNMKYIERCIMETLRLLPSAPAIGRKLTRDLHLGQKFAMFELKALVSTVLRSHKIEAVTKLRLTDLEWRITLKTKEPLLIKLSPRQQVHTE